MSNVVDLFNNPPRVNAKATIQGRVEELDEDDTHTDALVITFGADGLTIRSNAGGYEDILMLLQMVQQTVVNLHMYGGEDDEYEE
jgi:hypothetical protein